MSILVARMVGEKEGERGLDPRLRAVLCRHKSAFLKPRGFVYAFVRARCSIAINAH